MNNSIQEHNNFNQNQNGQSMVMVTLVLFTMVCFFAFAINVGHRVTEKVEMQNTIDSATYSAAVWNARGLNFISVLNVTMTECLALIILSKAWDKIISLIDDLQLIKATALTYTAAQAIPYIGWTFTCSANYFNTVTPTIFEVMQKIQTALNNIIDPLWTAMDVIQAFELGIKWMAPLAGELRASEIAKNKDAGELIPGAGMPKIGFYAAVFPISPLPVSEGDFQEICNRTLEEPEEDNFKLDEYIGWKKSINMSFDMSRIPGIGGFLDDLGVGSVAPKSVLQAALHVLTWPLCVPPYPLIPVPALWWDTTIDSAGASICSDGSDPPSLISETFTTADLSECAENNGTATWVQTTQSSYDNVLCSGGNVSESNSSSSTVTQPASWQPGNSYASTSSTGFCKDDETTEQCTCFAVAGCNGCTEETETGTRTKYNKTEWHLEKCEYDADIDTSFAQDEHDRPQPFMLTEPGWQQSLQFSGIAYKDVGGKLELIKPTSEAYNLEGEVTTNYVVARAFVYNHTAPANPDTFTQDWRVSLAPFTLEGFSIGLGLDDLLPASVTSMSDTIIDTISPQMEKILTH